MTVVRPDIKYTYAEYATLPEGSRYQLIEGDLILSPSPTRRHQTIVRRIFLVLNTFVAAQRLGEVYFSPLDVILDDQNVSQPDIFYVSNARASILCPEGARGGPDLCVEVLSPGTKELDRGRKRVLYARHGVIDYWVVDPVANTIELYRLQQDAKNPLRTFAVADTLATDLLPGFTMNLAEVFAD